MASRKEVITDGSVIAYIGLGSNFGDSVATLQSACRALAELPQTERLAISRFYRTSPMGPVEQPDFINAVAAIQTALAPLSLLRSLQDIERWHGRVPGGVRWGPRTLDLDVLLYGDTQIDQEILTIPHPGLHVRAFVLYPLHEIAPNLEIPGRGAVEELLKRVSDQPIEEFSHRLL